MPNWNGVPIPEAPQIKIPNSIPQNFNWNSYIADPKGTYNKFKGAREVNRLNWKGYSTAFNNGKKVILSSSSKKFIGDAMKQVRGLRRAKKIAQETKTVADKVKKVQDAFFKNMPGGANPKNSGIAGGTLISIVIQGGLAAAVINSILIQNSINDAVDRQLLRIGLDGSKVLTSLGTLYSRVGNLNTKLERFDKDLNANAKDYLQLNKQQEATSKNVVEAKKQANDALYETRQGRTILDGKVVEAKKQANDALYETRQNKISLENKVTESKKQSNDALYETRQTKFNLDAKIQQINGDIIRLNNSIASGLQNAVNSATAKLQAELAIVKLNLATIKPATPVDIASINANAVAAAKALVTPLQSQIGGIQTAVAGATGQASASLALAGVAINGVSNLAQGVSSAQAIAQNAQREAESSRTYVERVLVPRIEATVTKSTGLTAEMARLEGEQQDTRQYVERVLVPRIEATVTKSTGLTAEMAQLQGEQQDTRRYVERVLSTVTESTGVKAEVAQIQQQIPALSNEIKKTQIQVRELDTKIKEEEKVNATALPKLDQILGILPFIPARVADAIRPDIATLPQIEAAAAAGTCRTAQPGGCMSKALNDNATNINNNTNNKVGNILDAVNTGANVALLAGQQTILQRLGNQLPGGIGGKLSRFADWMHLDRVLNILIFAATVHNALMLSSDIGQTLLGAINNVLQLIGLKKEDGSGFDLGSVISGSIENLIKGAIGSDNYTSLREAWAKANRIYQATNNVINSFLNLSQTILQASELIAAYTGKIGNALKKGGVILEDAYGWLNPSPKFNRVTQMLESLQNGASTIQMVTQAPLDVINAVTESTTAATEFVKAVKEDDKPVNKAAPTPEPDELKAKESQSKTDSQPFAFDFSDLFDGED